jgi:hypothetical protein
LDGSLLVCLWVMGDDVEPRIIFRGQSRDPSLSP